MHPSQERAAEIELREPVLQFCCKQVLRGRAVIAQVLCRLGCCAKTTVSTTLGDGLTRTSQGHWLQELECTSGSACSTAATMYVL